MCGIAGLFKFDASTVEESQLRLMTSSLKHRGPDATGIYVSGSVGLGHTRLAILDLVPESNQPFFSHDGRFVLTYNGEVFNYIELKLELESLGHVFRTQSDTEVVLVAYMQWGPQCVNRFNGMWAFAIFDTLEQKLFCSRDRFGIKPFVYAFHNGYFAFASEIKALLEVFPDLRQPNYRSISICLRQGLSAGLEDTCFENVHRLPPSHCLMVTRNGFEKTQYWNYPTDINPTIDSSVAQQKILELLSDSVRIRMRSDVPVGLTLSSGLDSTAVAHLMRRQSTLPISTYTSCYESEYSSEAAVAKQTSADLNFDFSAVRCVGDDFLSQLRNVVRHIETPHCSPAMLPLWDIMKEAKSKVKVMLEGQGSDELFAGYLTIYYGFAAKEALRQRNISRFFAQIYGAFKVTHEHPLGSFYYTLSLLLRAFIPGSHKWIRKFGRGDEWVYVGKIGNYPDYEAPQDLRVNDLLNRRLVTAHHIELVDLLHYGDAISMAHGIESRLPFMDYRLVEFVFQLPGDMKIINGKAKHILREALAGVVPESIRTNQNKLGFTTPLSMWLRRNPEKTIYPVLFSEQCASRGIFNMQLMKQLIEKHVSGQRDYSQLIFRWLSCELWFQEFIDNSSSHRNGLDNVTHESQSTVHRASGTK